jgi:hypothetical protein
MKRSDYARATEWPNGAPTLYTHSGAAGSIFRGIVQQIEKHVLEQHGIALHHRQVLGQIDLQPMADQNLARFRGRRRSRR